MGDIKVNPLVKTAAEQIVKTLNERGWQMESHRGPEPLLKQGHDVRDVIRAELTDDAIKITLELCGFVGATGTTHTVRIPFDSGDSKETIFIKSKERHRHRLNF